MWNPTVGGVTLTTLFVRSTVAHERLVEAVMRPGESRSLHVMLMTLSKSCSTGMMGGNSSTTGGSSTGATSTVNV